MIAKFENQKVAADFCLSLNRLIAKQFKIERFCENYDGKIVRYAPPKTMQRDLEIARSVEAFCFGHAARS